MNLLGIQIQKAAYQVSSFPPLAVGGLILVIPPFDSIPVIGIASVIISYSHFTGERGQKGAPTDLHKAVRFQKDFIVPTALENSSIRSDTREARNCLNLKFVAERALMEGSVS
jgi:hypothetical protein